MTTRNQLVGQIQRPGEKPQNVQITYQNRPILTTDEKAAGLKTVNGDYEPGDVRRYGAKVDGSTDDSAAFAAAASVGIPVTLPEGTIKLSSITTISQSTTIRGAGKGRTIIDGTGISTTSGAVIRIEGSITERETPSANISKFDKSITFASAPTFTDGQVGMIFNPTTSSYSGFRSNYFEGEFFKVQDVAAQLDLVHALYSDYTAADIDIYSLDGVVADLSGFTVLAPDNVTAAISIKRCIHSTISNIECRNSTAGALVVDQCFDVAISDCTGIDRNDTDHGEDYALSISNSQNVRVSNCYFAARRHAITLGGTAEDGAVVCRNILISNCVMDSFTDDGSADIHGNSEYVTYSNCTINNGISTWGGNYNKLVNCQVYGDTATSVLAFSEMTGLQHTITGNTFYSNGGGSSTRAWGIDIGGNDVTSMTSDTTGEGTLTITNNTFINYNSAATSEWFLRIVNRGSTAELNIRFCNNVVQSADANSGRMEIDSASGNEWNQIVINDNEIDKGLIEIESSKYPTICRNMIHDASTKTSATAIQVNVSSNDGVAQVHGNHIKDAAGVGILVQESPASTGLKAFVSNNYDVGSGGTYGIQVSGIDDVYLFCNVSDNAIRVQTCTNLYANGNTGVISRSSVTNYAEMGFDSSLYLIAPSLPTSSPGGSFRLWSNSNVVNLT